MSTELTLEFDRKATQNIKELMSHYNLNSSGDVVRKALAVLQVAAHVDKTHGQLIARKGARETHIIVR